MNKANMKFRAGLATTTRNTGRLALKVFQCLARPNRLLCRYWEIVELIRKLILAGLIGLFGRGTVLQIVVTTVISFVFFALAFREMPYNSARLNAIKVLSELQL